MRIITQKELTEKLFDHPYTNSPNYHAAMSVVHMSSDGKLLIGYWHAPEGEVIIDYGMNVEYNYVIEGKFELLCDDGRILSARAGDIIECGGQACNVTYRIKEYAKTVFIVYPQSAEDVAFVQRIQAAKGSLEFQIK